ncbi:hypothetical protein GGE50_006073 [Rhizobium leguminosarum]|nr:hypothetical protein [Rhizobium leguminosarum]
MANRVLSHLFLADFMTPSGPAKSKPTALATWAQSGLNPLLQFLLTFVAKSNDAFV